MKRIFETSLAATLLTLSTTPLHAMDEQPTLELDPSSDWRVDYAEDSCHLIRNFGEGDEKIIALFSRYAPSNRFELTLAGKPIADKADWVFPATLSFNPNGGEKRFTSGMIARLGDGGDAVYLSTLLGEEDDEDDDGTPIRPDEALEQGIQQLSFDQKRAAPITLNLGPMGEPMKALRTCTRELVEHWGIDAAVNRSLTRRATPTSKAESWITWRDYMRVMDSREHSARLPFRLLVDKEGTPTACSIQLPDVDQANSDALCAVLMRRAHFEPALDAAEQPTASYYANVVWFLGG